MTGDASHHGRQSGAAARLLRGELGLPTTFWLFAVAGNLALMALVGLLPAVIGLAVGLPLWLAYLAVVAIGTWRAAGRYEGPAYWAAAARFAVAVSVIAVLALLALLAGLDRLTRDTP
jgi:hypothetical protein